MATIELKQVEKRFGENYAVQPMDLRIGDGEFVALLGPSGCGKTTTLRMIAGLETTSGGTITIDNKDVTRLKPSERDIAMVFQFFALYPHLSARENIAFPLKTQNENRASIEKKVSDTAKLLQIESLLNQKPPSLSSGDQQRVALARALVRKPACFLMDEPLGALDAEFRETMRSDIKKLMRDTRGTTVYVTHDQIEAMAMADRIVVMSQGVVQQIGTPAEVYHDPKTLFVAKFIGSPGMNLVQGETAKRMIQNTKHKDAQNVVVGFRPEALNIHPDGALLGSVYSVDLHGSYTMLLVNIDENQIHARVSRDNEFRVGDNIRFDLIPERVRVFDSQTERSVNSNS
jgi:multiple sugar transport system ATP-binding protein